MSESIKAAREKAWKDFVGDNSGNIYQPISFNAGFDAAQKVADEQNADLRNRLEAAETLIKSLTYFQVRDSTEIVELFEGVWKIHRPEFTEVEFRTAPEAFQALKELQEATKDE